MWPSEHPSPRWATIGSRYRVVEKLPTADQHRTVAAIVEVPVGKLLVDGTVMPWQHDGVPDGLARGWERHHRVVPQPCAEWSEVLQAHPAISVPGPYRINQSAA